MPYVQCPQCQADCLVITFSSRTRRHTCPLCGTLLDTERKRPPSGTPKLASVREASSKLRGRAPRFGG